MNIVICDTCSLIKLQKGGIIDCLSYFFESVYIPQAVEQECFKGEAKKAIQKSFIKVVSVKHTLPLGMGKGEREAISLAVELGINDIITDDDKAIKVASKNGLLPLTAFDIIIMAKKKGLITSAKTVMQQMIKQGEGIKEERFKSILEKAGELS
jgi:uncharacterized protein